MIYSPPSGLEPQHWAEVIRRFSCRQQLSPQTVLLKDYNYQTPSLEVSGQATVSPDGRGEIYIYGEHFRTPEEGGALARVRCEEYLCRQQHFFGESTVPFARPGYVFSLEDHYRPDFN